MARVSKSTERSFRKAARRIKKFARSMEGETGKTIRQVGEEVMTDVKASRPGKGVPVDLGPLRASGQVTGPNNGVVVLSFGGPSADYALIQHERMDFAHDVGEARYLVRGLERWEPAGSQAMAALKANAEAGIRAARAG